MPSLCAMSQYKVSWKYFRRFSSYVTERRTDEKNGFVWISARQERENFSNKLCSFSLPLSVNLLPLNSVGSYKAFHAITHSSEFLGQGIVHSRRLHLQRKKKGTRKIMFIIWTELKSPSPVITGSQCPAHSHGAHCNWPGILTGLSNNKAK
jgi:hypothetical protein